jgi:hypothetical protein
LRKKLTSLQLGDGAWLLLALLAFAFLSVDSFKMAKTPTKKPAKAPKKAGDKKRKKKRTESRSICIYKFLKQVHPDTRC